MRVLTITNMYPTPGHPAQGTFVEQQVESLRAAGLTVDLVHIRRVDSGRKAYATAFWRIRSCVRNSTADLVHVVNGGYLAAFTAASVRSPFVISFCGSDLLGEPLAGYLGQRIGRSVVSASHWAARRADGIIVKSPNLYKALPQFVNRQNVWMLPNGVDMRRFRPMDRVTCQTSLGWDPYAFNILFAGAMANPTKRFDLARRAARELQETGVRAVLHILPGVEHQSVPIWLNAADCLLMCSAHEGSPNIVKEALVCNRPIVSTDVGDVRERVHGVDGCYIAEPSAEDLARKLRLVFRGPRITSGRPTMADLSSERVAERVIQIYHNVLEQHRIVACRDAAMAT